MLAARLADARFFWEQDLKVPLEEQAKKLGGIVFHEKLGTVADKVERVAKLARWLVESGVVKADADQVERAARLAKADLVTGMVGEFPELQGVIGGYLAEAQGEPKAVADAIRDHYKPVGQGDEVRPRRSASRWRWPTSSTPSAPSSASIRSRPDRRTRSRCGERRSASIEIIVGNGLRLLADRSGPRRAGQPCGQVEAIAAAAHRLDRTAPEVIDFFADRLKVQQREAGVRHDLIDAVFALGGEDDLVRLLARVKALQDFVETEDGADLLTAYKRAANILKKEDWTRSADHELAGRAGDSTDRGRRPARAGRGAGPEGGDRGDGVGTAGAELPQEKALIAALDAAEPKASAAIDREDFTAAMAALASLRGPIDDFFDHVTVNDPDPAKRERRLNLLMRFRDAVNRVADFSRIEG